MHHAINFVIESGISLSLLSVFYILLLRKETFFRKNRMFLLISVVFSVVLPFLKFRLLSPQPVMLSEITVTPYRNLIEVVNVYGRDLSGAVVRSISSSSVIIGLYLSGLLFFLGRFLFRVFQVWMLIQRNDVQRSGAYRFVFIRKDFSPFSFLNYIFVNPEMKRAEGFDKMIAHEVEHVKQGHTLDVLILELLTAFQWLNPCMWLLRRSIRENHEFLADQAVLNAGVSPAYYKKLLLNQVVGIQMKMANSFNSSLIKNRIKMITKIRSSKMAQAKFLLGMVVALALILLFACEQKETLELKSEETEIPMQLSLVDGKIKIEGSVVELEKVKSMFSGNSGFNVESDSLGNLLLMKKTAGIPQTIEGEPIFLITEKMPEFPGGEKALREWINRNVNYPPIARDSGIQGKVFITFVVTKDGAIANAEIARGVDPSLDKEALRIINALPQWKPGYQQGKPVHVKYTVPIHFVLQ